MNITATIKSASLWGFISIFSMNLGSTAIATPVPIHHQTTVLSVKTTSPPPDTAIKPQTQPILAPKDQGLFDTLMTEAKRYQIRQKSYSDSLKFFSHQLLGQPYQAGLLDQSPNEALFLSLTQFDCVLFVEAVLALAHSARQPSNRDKSPTTLFSEQVQNLRYRDGIRDGYCSRLHYFSEWLDNNQSHGYLKNMSQELGGIPLNKKLQFMSRHRNSYPQLKNDKSYHCIINREDRLASLPMYYIPTSRINQIADQLKSGDIVAVATAVPHLDVTHTGLISRESHKKMRLIHASPGGSVRLANDLTRYVSNVESAIGIMVARPLEDTTPM